jgi:hypothetical protein
MQTVGSAEPNQGNFPLPGISFSAMIPRKSINRIQLADLGREPFRIFFPAAVLAGIIGVGLWPLYFGHIVTLYPGLIRESWRADFSAASSLASWERPCQECFPQGHFGWRK